MLDDEPASEDEEAPHLPDQPSEPTWLPSRRVRSKRGQPPFDQRPDGSIFGPPPASEYGGDSVFPPAHEVPLPEDDEELGNTDGSIPSDGPLPASTPGVLSRGVSSAMGDDKPPSPELAPGLRDEPPADGHTEPSDGIEAQEPDSKRAQTEDAEFIELNYARTFDETEFGYVMNIVLEFDSHRKTKVSSEHLLPFWFNRCEIVEV